MAKAKKKLTVTQRKSLNKCVAAHRACVRGLGLRRIGHTVSVEDSAEVRGMIGKVSYLVKIVEA